MSRTKKYIRLIKEELNRAKSLHPKYPKSMFKKLAIMQEESGEVAKAVNEYHEGRVTIHEVEDELIQTASSCLRMLNSIHRHSKR